ncbi:MAG: nucleotidyltransferase family protein [Gammaproteobacteria bacterium]|nr:nucleotidyltransferase family protein [Gammaproteobacteria bacterium]
MKAIVLAAGRGKRMRPLTNTIPKPLLPVNNKRLIEYHLERLVASGLRDIVINHAHLGAQIEKTLGDGQRYGAKIRYSPEGEQKLGTGGGILHALPLLGQAPFLVVNGDIWCEYDFMPLRHAPQGLVHLVLVDNPEHNQKGDFALRRGQVLPGKGPRLTYSGIGVYNPQLFNGCTARHFPLSSLIQQAIQAGRATGEYYPGPWIDVGTPARLQRLEKKLRAKHGSID